MARPVPVVGLVRREIERTSHPNIKERTCGGSEDNGTGEKAIARAAQGGMRTDWRGRVKGSVASVTALTAPPRAETIPNWWSSRIWAMHVNPNSGTRDSRPLPDSLESTLSVPLPQPEPDMAKTAVSAATAEDLSLADLQAEAETLRKRINRFRESLGRFFVNKQEIIDLMVRRGHRPGAAAARRPAGHRQVRPRR